MPGNYYNDIMLIEPSVRYANAEAAQTAEDVNDSSSVELFAQKTPQIQDNEINLSEIDIDKLINDYKDNPFDAINELGIEFTDEEKAELNEFITNKKRLKTFFKIIKNNNALNSKDIMSAMRKVRKFRPNGFFKRTFNVIKSAFTDGLSEAIDLAKSETAHYAGKLGKNMNEIRSERADFSSDTVADVGDTITQQPETKEGVMHFVLKNNKDGSKLYTEDDVIQARNIIVENIESAKEFTSNAVELESIKDNNGFIKYKGSTIVNVGDRMTKNHEVKSTMLNVAKKSDMTDEYLENTTANLAKNHSIAQVIDFMVRAKDTNGRDSFTANSVSSESTYLQDKDQKYCASLTATIKEIVQNTNISSEDILSKAHDAVKNPCLKNKILSNTHSYNLNTNEESNEKLNKHQLQSLASASGEATNILDAGQQQTFTNPISHTLQNNNCILNNTFSNGLITTQNNYENSEKQQISEATIINGETYERSEILRELRKKFGVTAEKILNKIESDGSFIEIMKQYSGNKTIIAALVEDPYLITKIKKVSGSIALNELADVIKLCTDTASTNVMLESLRHSSPQEAMMITKKSKILNLKDDALDILSSAKSSVNKRHQIDDLLLNGTKSKEFIS